EGVGYRIRPLRYSLKVVPHVELRRPARAAVADRPHDQERRRIHSVAGWIVEVGAIRHVEHVNVGHDAAVAVAWELEPVGGADTRERKVGAAGAVESAL